MQRGMPESWLRFRGDMQGLNVVPVFRLPKLSMRRRRSQRREGRVFGLGGVLLLYNVVFHYNDTSADDHGSALHDYYSAAYDDIPALHDNHYPWCNNNSDFNNPPSNIHIQLFHFNDSILDFNFALFHIHHQLLYFHNTPSHFHGELLHFNDIPLYFDHTILHLNNHLSHVNG